MTYSCKFCGRVFLYKDLQERHVSIGGALGCEKAESVMKNDEKVDNKKLSLLEEGKRVTLSDGRVFEKKNGYILPVGPKT